MKTKIETIRVIRCPVCEEIIEIGMFNIETETICVYCNTLLEIEK